MSVSWKPSGQIVVKNETPYLLARSKIWKRNGDGGWFSVADIPSDPLLMTDGHICTPEETEMYGVVYSEEIWDGTYGAQQ